MTNILPFDRISLNSIIAIYAVLLKASIALVVAEGIGQLKWSWFGKVRPLADLVNYDDASRGPSGALSLLWRLRGRHFLASLGAVITVLALATDPFAQQIVHYRDCSIPVPGMNSSLPRTNYYYEEGGLHTGALYQSIVPGVQSAINAGVFSPSGSPDAECQTGNCTWVLEYSSVGWCSACEDITHLLSITNHTSHVTEGNSNYTFTQWNLTTVLPDGGLGVWMVSETGTEEYAAMGATPVNSQDVPGEAFVTSIDFVLGQNLMGTMNPSTGESWPDCNSTAANATWKCQGYGASRCQLFSCVKTFNASVNTGRLTETLIGTSSNWGGNGTDDALTMLDTHCINSGERQSLESLGYDIRDNERWLAYNITFMLSTWPELNDTFPESMVIRDCLYAVDMTFMNSLDGYLVSLFSGNVTGPVVAPEAPLGEFSGPQALQAFFNFGDVTLQRVDDTFANITASLTNYIRQNSVANFSTPALGVASQDKTCIVVRWPWLLFPATLVLLTLIFFVLTLLETRPTGTRPDIWKSSPLALLYHGLAHEDGRGAALRASNNMAHIDGMQALADATAVKLNSSNDGVARLEVQ